VRSRRWMRIGSGLLVAAAGVAAIGIIPTSAAADPTPNTDPMQQYKDLSAQAAQADEDLLSAQNDLATKQAQLTQAKQTLQQAQAVENQFRGQVDQLTAASFEGVRMNQLSALLTGTSARDYLDRATLLQEVSADNAGALRKFDTATQQAAAAQQQAQNAETAAAQLVSTITQRKQALQTQITQVQQALAKLTATQRRTLNNVGDTTTVFLAPGILNTVIQAALSRRGDAYVWGASGPSQFDCSGLTMWAYAHAGISLPHSSRSQYDMGTPVSYGQWQAGDLLFFGSSASTIHHVAMYVGSGEIVQAPTEGVPVQVVPVSGGGSDYFGAKRIVSG
jgi:cell wall-associated NlpC family hydrolase